MSEVNEASLFGWIQHRLLLLSENRLRMYIVSSGVGIVSDMRVMRLQRRTMSKRRSALHANMDAIPASISCHKSAAVTGAL
jgi:hypothetical protein